MLNAANEVTIAQLRGVLPAAAFRPVSRHHVTEPRGRYAGKGIVIAPGTTDEVAAVVRHCRAAGLGIVPFGGGTGLVGGQVKEEGPAPVILSLERMTAIRAVHPAENVLIAEAGAILADVQAAAAEAGRLFPMSLDSEGSARIGGLLATNAGGVNVLRYGNMRTQCLGLEVVTPEGEIWHGLSRLRKDNTGYDLRDLLIGSEGTLGVITAASLRMVPRPRSEAAAFLAVADPAAALDLLSLAGEMIGGDISAFELIHRQGPDFLREVGPDVRMPFSAMPDWMVLIDVGRAEEGAAPEALESLFFQAFEAGLVSDGVLSASDAQRAAMWHLRESIPEANKRIGAISSHDIAVPISAVPAFIAEGQAALAGLGDMRINCFGHLGDGNLHYNVFPAKGRAKEDDPDLPAKVQVLVHDLVVGFGGSISAEHGIGRLKAQDLIRYGDPVKLAMMRAVKQALDPAGIMNPGAVLA